MKLSLVNFQSKEEIHINAEYPVIIGRGSLLGCSDKKVSRNHGKMQLTPEGNLLLISLHSNPCFFMKNGLPPVYQLGKNEKQLLKNGDYIGLLPDSFWYKIVVENSNFSNSLVCYLDGSNGVSNESESFMGNITEDNEHPVCKQDSQNLKSDKRSELDTSKGKGTSENQEMSSDSCLTERLKSLEKTKKLPLSMYKIDDFPAEIELENSQDSAHHIENNLSAATETDNDFNNMPTTSSAEIKLEKQSKINQDYVQDSDQVNVTQNDKGNNNGTKKDCPEDAADLKIHSERSKKRPFCQYEENCFRKNKDHQREFCHPGDPDFIQYEKRPKCRYGASCYRRNKTHRVEYQHPLFMESKGYASTGSPRRKHQKKKGTEYHSWSEEDDYDFEDPFIADGSSDEYIPSDTDSDDDVDGLNPEECPIKTRKHQDRRV